MSSDSEIQEVYLQEIAQKTKQVRSKQSILPFLDGMDGMSVKELYWGIMDDSDRDLLCRVIDNDVPPTEPTDEQIIAALKELAADGIDIVDLAEGAEDD